MRTWPLNSVGSSFGCDRTGSGHLGLGVTVYEAITGRLPFPAAREDGAPYERFPQLVHEPTPFSDDVPPVLADPVMSCLRKRPEDRPTAEELAGALQPLVAALPKPIAHPEDPAPSAKAFSTMRHLSRPSYGRLSGGGYVELEAR